MYRIRRWTDEGWRALAEALTQRGLAVVVTGGPAQAEKEYLDRVWNPVRPPVERMDGRLDGANWRSSCPEPQSMSVRTRR